MGNVQPKPISEQLKKKLQADAPVDQAMLEEDFYDQISQQHPEFSE